MSKQGKLTIIVGDATRPQKQAPNEIAVITHCCNNKNIWGGGFVIALSKKWEKPEQVYRDFCTKDKTGYSSNYPVSRFPILGKVCYAKINDHLAIANMIGQDGIVSNDNPTPIKYKALADCMTEVMGYIELIKMQTSNPVVIHSPKFGSLRANGNWDFIMELIREIWLENGINVVIYEFKE